MRGGPLEDSQYQIQVFATEEKHSRFPEVMTAEHLNNGNFRKQKAYLPAQPLNLNQEIF